MPAVIWQLAKNFWSQNGHQANINADLNLQIFYFIVAVFLLVVVIITYPTLRDRNRKKK